MMLNSSPQKPPENDRPIAQDNERSANAPAPDESEIANASGPRDEFEYQRRLFFGR